MTVRRISKIQKQFWILNEIYPHSGAYNLYSVFRLSEPLNYEYLQRAVRTVIGRHEPLRTSFELIDNELSQSIRTSDETDFSINEVKINENYVEDVVNTEIINEVNRPFDLSKSPIFRFSIFSFKNHVSVLSLVFHHIIIDVRSEGIFAKELSEVYNSLVEKREMKLEAVRFQYSDYIDEISSWYASDQYLEKLKELDHDSPDPNTVIKLPEDRINDGNVSNDGSGVYFSLEKQFSDKIKQFTEKNNINAYRVFLAAYAILLYRLSNQEKISIGLPLTNRTRPVSKSTFGCFINALPLLVDFSDDKSSKVVLENVSGSLTRLLDRQEVPFTDLVIHSRHESNTTVNPYFQTGFAFKPPMQLEIDNIEARPLKIIHRENQNEFDLLLTLYPDADGFTGYARYSAQLFRGETVNKWIELYKKIVSQLIEYPESSVNRIDIVSDEDKKRLNEFNRTEVAIPECLLQNFFEQQAGMRPEKTAIISGGISHSYRELEERSNQLANYLGSLGVKQGDIVGVCLERSFEMVVSVLGVLKAGCCYLPMDPSFPEERISYMYEDSGAKVLISQSTLRDKLSHFTGATIVLTDLDRDRIGGNSSEKPEIIIDNQSLAYIIYTSGSTGKPKGVKVPHEGVVNLIGSMTRAPGIKADDILLAVVTLSFDMSVYELFVPLSSGATVVVATSRDTTDGQALIGLMDKYNITMLQATPSLWNILLASGWQGKKDLRAFCGGEALTRNMVREMLPRVSEFWNCYGPTETTVYSAIVKVTDPEAPIVIGKPIENTRIYILDKNGNQVPVGVTGEVCIGGRGVTKGYNNLPELTGEKFIRLENGEVIYKTGDLGKFLGDGTIELFGRSDNQIKLRGFRIEPGEIESLLSQLPGVKEAVVKIHRFDEHDQRLVAFLNVTGEFRLSREEMTESLSHRLPGYMIPSFFQTSDGFPRLPNGKINKKALILEIDESDKKHEIDFDSLTETQKKLFNIWEDILKIKSITPSSNFFDLGGNSLLAISLLNKIKEELGFTLSFKDYITNATILKLGAFIDSQFQIVDKGITLIHLTEMTNLPLTLNQKSLWLISQLHPDIPLYIIPYTYRFRGSLDREIFQKSINILFRRHSIVFSVMKETNGEPYCDIVLSQVDISFIDYSELPETEIPGKLDDLFNSDARKPFDLQNGLLYRLYLVKTGKDEFYFRLSIHHIIFDGWSWSVLIKDLNVIYNSLLKGDEINLSKTEFQQYDYAQWEKNSVGSKFEDESIKFWKENLQDASPILNFPYDYQRSDKPSGRARFETIKLSLDLTEKLRRISKDEGSSLFTTMLSVFGLQMHKYSGEADINIGLPVAYRPHSKLENIVGMFVNTVVVRLRYEKEFSFRSIIRRTNEAALNAIAHQNIPFEKVVEIVNPERSAGANPLFQVAFDWQNNLEEPIKLDFVSSDKIIVKERSSNFDITLYMWEDGSNIEGEIEYNIDLLKTSTVIRLRDNFLHLMQSLIEYPDQMISEISFISENDKKMLLEFNRTEIPVTNLYVQNSFENLAESIPLKTAVISGGRSLNYLDLNNKSNQLANYLVSNGVFAGDIVGLCVERSVDMVMSVLGILKAGCCYLPMDPSFPDDRIKYMYEDSGAKVLISQSSLKKKFGQFANTQIILTDTDNERISKCSTEKHDLNISSQSLAYIIYTSGSTGKPKGVKVHHEAVVNFLNSMTRKPGFSNKERLLAVTTLSFDISVLELFLPLSCGAEVIVAEADDISDGLKLSELLDQYDITVMQATPATWNILIGSGWQGKKNLKTLCGGEPILPGLIKELLPKVETLWNMYGPTETTVWSTCNKLTDSTPPILVGAPIDNTRIYILDKNNTELPVGVTGEVCIGGLGVTKGYHNRPELTAEKFIPFENDQIIYKTGDLGRFLEDGNIELFGRIDNQIKLRGFRIEPGEIESLLSRLPGVKEAVVTIHKFDENDERLVAFLNVDPEFGSTKEDITGFLSHHLPFYMIPSFFQSSKGFPRLPNGKINKKALSFKISESIQKIEIDTDSLTETEKKILNIWRNVLKNIAVGLNTNFFEAGGTSILIPLIISSLKQKFNIPVKSINIFEYPTIKSLAEYISKSESGKTEVDRKEISFKSTNGTFSKNRDIAVIGMACCFPGADNIDQYWEVIKNGVEAISFFTKEELKNKGVPEELLNNPHYVYANSITAHAEMFDSSFFEISSREADFMDPQHRLFLEICYEALENSGYAPRTQPRNIGVFAGTGMNTYLIKSLIKHPEALRSIGEFQNMINSDKDFLTTRVSYKLNLTGPSIDIQTACSTSMVATHIACQSLYNHDCDMALSGGVSIQLPRGNGYMYQKGGILSPTGHCRPFDEKADGILLGEGAGVILLKRLEDAVRDNDNIYAVIKSVAINNDGSTKAGYMTPSLDGEAKVIRQALDQAGILPETISFVETHGTATKLGDPIEIAALRKAFAQTGEFKAFCALGGVKANIGHLDAASGIAGIIKTVLALKNKQIPPLVNFESSNRDLEIENSPFYINTKLKDWQTDNMPRRAGVSSFGIGGTNAHCIIEEWQPEKSNITSEIRYHLMPISAMVQVSLDKLSEKYLSYFEHTTQNISDIAYTMQQGREFFKFRQLFVTDDLKVKLHLITNKGIQLFEKPRTAFMFTGQGSQYVSMAKGLYDNFTTFKKHIDKAGDFLNKKCGIDLLRLLFESESKSDINETVYAQPAIVAVQYALVKLLEEFGIKPDILIGHSIGELTAACISGVFSFEDILVLSANRGKIMHEQERGSMLSVNLPFEKLTKILTPGVEISLINAPEYCVVSGTVNVISDFKEHIAKIDPGIQTVLLKTSHAFHSSLMDPAVSLFKDVVEKTLRKEINIPFISNSSGVLIKNEEAQSATYWSGHIRKPVNFSQGVKTLLENQIILLEIGPGSMLTSLLSQFKSEKGFKAIPTMRGAKQETDDVLHFMNAVSQFWINGGDIKWSELHREPCHKVPAPTYSFNRKRHWVDTKSCFSFDYDQDGSGEETYRIDYIDENTAETLDRSGFVENYVEANTEIQQILVKIWEDYLGVKYIGIIDDFFSLGGHSLLASQVINKVNEHFKIDLPIESLFRIPTIEKLEKAVDEARKNTTLHLNLIKIENSYYLPVSNEQTRLWTVCKFDNNPAYNIPFTYRFKGKLNEDILHQSINAVFNKHDILRGRIAEVDLRPALVLDKKGQVTINRIDLSDIPPVEREKKIELFIGEDVRKTFNIGSEPLYRIYLIKTGEDEVLFHVTVHHVIFDGWSWGVFVRDLIKAYNGLSENQEFALSDDVHQYYEYAQWQLTNASEQKISKSIEYWKEKLKGHNGLLNFPYDFPRKAIRSGFGKKEFFKIDPIVQSKLKNLAKDLNCTDFMVYISAFSILLNKYSKDEDICIGIPVANRPSYQLEEIIGFFVNTLVLRFQIDDKATFKEYLSETKKMIIEAFEHQEIPFEKIVETVNPARTFNMNPLYQVTFAWLNTPSEIFELQDVIAERCTIRNGVAPLDLTIYVWEEKGHIEGEIEYSIDLLEDETILRLRNNFLNLLNKLAENSDTSIGALSMISENERKIIDGFNDTLTNYPKEKTIAELLEDLTNLYPDKTAVVFKENSLTYRQLNEKTNQLARVLRKSGIKANDPVCILIDRSVEMIVGIFGILKAGGAYVPLDPEYPEYRKNFIIKDSGCKILVTQNKYSSETTEGITKLCLDSSSSYHDNKSNIEVINVSSDLAYIIYTSGTTGVPKGTLIPQKGVVRLVRNTNYVDFTPEDRVLQSTSIVFDASTVGIFGALLNGATLYLIDKETLLDPNSLGDELTKNDITMTDFPTAIFTQIAELRPDIFNKLKTLLVGGDALSAPHVNKVRKINPQLTIINEYGPTENSCNSTAYKVDRDFEYNIPIGRPISNSTAYIFDKNMNYQPIGMIGELYVGGDGLSKGYLNREDLNKTSFIDHPYFPGKRLYKTGDLARWLPDGNIEFHGRIDNQLKIRGFRVELGEIESVISDIDGIIETVIKPIKIEEGDYKLVAFLNVPETFKMDSKEISSLVKEKLPSYMVPIAYKLMHGFPKTINGKIDRKALNFDLQELKNKNIDESYPLNSTERIIHGIWCEALKTKDISTTDNFFDIGGNSLLAINLVDQLSKAFNKTLKTFMIFEFPTIKDQSEFFAGKDNDNLSLKNIKIDNKIQQKKNVIFKKHREK